MMEFNVPGHNLLTIDSAYKVEVDNEKTEAYLNYCVTKNRHAVVKILLERNVRVTILTILEASKYGDCKMCQLFDKYEFTEECCIEAIKSDDIDKFEWIANRFDSITFQDNILLIRACIYGNYKAVKYLLDRKADKTAKNEAAMYWAKKNRYENIVKLLE